jgi:hypothetical protein
VPDGYLAPSALTGQTIRAVNTKHFPASGAGPKGALFLKKAPQSIIPEGRQIFNHAHAVFQTISPVEASKRVAWEAIAVSTETSAAAGPLLAILDSAIDAGAGFAEIIASATRASMAAAQEGVTQAAIHTARSDKGALNRT